MESPGSESEDCTFTVVDETGEMNGNGIAKGCLEDLSTNNEEDIERSVISAKEQLRKEMTVYEV